MRNIVLWMFVFGACLYEGKATLTTIFFEDLCNDKQNAIGLKYVPTGILLYVPPRLYEPFNCTVTLKPQFGYSTVLSLYSYYIGENKLTVEDSDRHKIQLLDNGYFEDESKSIVSEGKITIEYNRKYMEALIYDAPSENETQRSPLVPGFQFTFTQVANGPCADKDYTCDNGKCIPQKYLCDGHNHCGDNSNQKYCYIKKKIPTEPPILNTRLSVIWVSITVVAGIALLVLIIVFIVVLVRRSKNTKSSVASSNNPNTGANNAPLQSVSSTVPANQPQPPANATTPVPTSNGQPPDTSLYGRVRRSFRMPTGTRVNEPAQQHVAESYQVPSMYPSLDHIPSAPVYHGAVNPEFKIEE